MPTIRLGEIAYARSGDKGSGENIGILAHTQTGYNFLAARLTSDKVHAYFEACGVTRTVRYELPNLLALNFVLSNVLDGGGSVSLRIDAQGKAMGQTLLEMNIDVPTDVLKDCHPERYSGGTYRSECVPSQQTTAK